MGDEMITIKIYTNTARLPKDALLLKAGHIAMFSYNYGGLEFVYRNISDKPVAIKAHEHSKRGIIRVT